MCERLSPKRLYYLFSGLEQAEIPAVVWAKNIQKQIVAHVILPQRSLLSVCSRWKSDASVPNSKQLHIGTAGANKIHYHSVVKASFRE